MASIRDLYSEKGATGCHMIRYDKWGHQEEDDNDSGKDDSIHIGGLAPFLCSSLELVCLVAFDDDIHPRLNSVIISWWHRTLLLSSNSSVRSQMDYIDPENNPIYMATRVYYWVEPPEPISSSGLGYYFVQGLISIEWGIV